MAIQNITKHTPELAGLLLAIIASVTLFLGFEFSEENTWIRHTVEIEAALHNLEATLTTAESAQRGFLLTKNDDYLNPYRDAVAELPSDIEQIRKLIAGNPVQVEEFAELNANAESRMQFLARTIKSRQSGDEASVAEALRAHRGMNAMTKVKASLDKMEAAEHSLLKMRTASAARLRTFLTIGILTGLLALIAAVGIWVASSRRDRHALTITNNRLLETIAEKEAADEQIRQMQKMEAIGQLTGGIAHDFNNMLAVIISAINLAKRRMRKAETETVDGLLDNALDGAQRAAALVKRLLAFARQQPLAPQVIDANRHLTGMAELLSRTIGENIRTEFVTAAGLWLTRADTAQLENSILNLCVNARDAMPNGGKLTIETANCHLDDSYSRAHPGIDAGQYVLIAVTDDGTGMTPDVKSKAFEPFFTTKTDAKGNGLGLPQVFGFVKQSGGHIKIYTEPNEGTTIKLYLPRDYSKSPDEVTARPTTNEQGGTETILLVDDEERVLSLAAESLRELGYTVIEANGAETALRILKSSSNVNMLLTDIVMPGLNGRRLADLAVAARPQLKVLFMTGFTKNAIVHNGVLDPGVHFLPKPFTLGELATKVRETIDYSPSPAAD